MSHFQDAQDLIIHTKEKFEQIKIAYSQSIQNQEIKKSLLIDVKNLMENLRSALDFCAYGLFEKYGFSKKNRPQIYFPYATLKTSKVAFQREKIIENKIPGIESRPDIVKLIEEYQHFQSPNNKWLPVFMDLNNENKHLKLTPQTKKNQKQLIIASGNKGLPFGIGSQITIENGAKFQFGNTVIEGNQTFSAENPPKIKGAGYSVLKSWTAVLFDKNNEEVLPFLEKSLIGVDKIVGELSKI